MENLDIQYLKKYSLEDKSLRDYQQENKQKIYDAWGSTSSVMLQMPTGTGKTRLFVSIIKDLFNYSRQLKSAIKVLILVHRTELIEQISDELGIEYNLAHGIIQSGNRERKKYPIQVASVPTLSRRLDTWTDKEFDFIIVDEAHHVTADSYQKIIRAFPHAKLLGVTATPVRLSGEGFSETFETLIVSPSVKEFINMGYLSPYDYYSVARSSGIQKDIDEIKKFSQGDYAESEMVRVCDNDHIRAQVVKTYLDYANGKKGIVYTINKQHNKNLCKEFCENGIEAVAIDSDTKSDLREKYIEEFKQGKCKIICNVNLFSAGFDCPDIEFIQLARPTKSLALYLQQVGRGLRISDSKERTIFLDNVGLYNRFSFPSSRRMWKKYFNGNGEKDNEEKELENSNDTNKSSEVRIVRFKNLKEGKEIVHLIHTSDNKEWYESRKVQVMKIFEKYQTDYVNACNSWFAHNNFYADLEDFVFTDDLKKKRKDVYSYCCYTIRAKKKNPFMSGYRYFTFYKTEGGSKTNNREFRAAKTVDEYIDKMTDDLDTYSRKYINADLRRIVQEFNKSHFSENEFLDIIEDLISSNWKPEVKPYTADRCQYLFCIILRLYYHILYSNIKGTKGILHFCLLANEEANRILLNKDND